MVDVTGKMNYVISSAMISPFEDIEKAKSFAIEYEALIRRYTDKQITIYVASSNKIHGRII